MWKEGVIGVPKKEGTRKSVHYWIEVYEEGSQLGINGGRISKLSLKMDGEYIGIYDRGWDIKPTCEEAEMALSILLYSNN